MDNNYNDDDAKAQSSSGNGGSDHVRFQYETIIDFISHNDQMRQAAKSSLKQGLYAGGGAITGGLLLGPIGGLVGGISGSIVGYMKADNYSGVVQQLMQLDTTHRQRLVDGVGQVLRQAGAAPQQFETADLFRDTLRQMAMDRGVRDKIWKACVDALN